MVDGFWIIQYEGMQGNGGGVVASAKPAHGRPASLAITLPPLAVVAFKWQAG